MKLKEKRIDKGITLVALVVTIIVLLILAGVILNLVAGSNGIIGKASTAVDEYTMQAAREQAEIDLAQILMEQKLLIRMAYSQQVHLLEQA